MRIVTDPAAPYDDLVSALLPDPNEPLARGVVLPGKGRGCVTAVVMLAGERYLLKKYAYRGLWYGLRHRFKRSRALRVFVNQRYAWLAGVATPEPLACIEERRHGMLRDCFVLYRYVADSVTLKECWQELPPAQRVAVLNECGRQFGALHRGGLTHGDSNWRNILVVRAASGAVALWLIDFDGSMRPVWRRNQKFNKDLDHFLRDMRWRSLPDEDLRIFLAAWRSTAVAGNS